MRLQRTGGRLIRKDAEHTQEESTANEPWHNTFQDVEHNGVKKSKFPVPVKAVFQPRTPPPDRPAYLPAPGAQRERITAASLESRFCCVELLGCARPAGSAIIDGEIVGADRRGTPDFSVRQNELKGESAGIVLIAFDRPALSQRLRSAKAAADGTQGSSQEADRRDLHPVERKLRDRRRRDLKARMEGRPGRRVSQRCATASMRPAAVTLGYGSELSARH